jgi:hypothetical protein
MERGMTGRAPGRTRVTKVAPTRRPGLPARDTPMPPMGDAEALAFARRIVDLATDKKASDVVLRRGELTTLADY